MSVDKTANSSDRLNWFKSTYSGGAGGECLEVATCLHTVHVRDTKDTDRPGLAVGSDAWTAFVGFAAEELG
ncbi:DUF397 domain-containing protein [Streptomyces phyllanthi]|uniref:DUF397 domain-containing protein n=1 Tax=Streptomyces phyllanthi TaxID=1803180 RepID=A0A5N8W2E3_9ACTN|nr:DUF397 domain-containing protein [Streptomyces phyllanthi]MPY41660.1 DUF397 domain-containing protein [Streptomyces phyllanthi]